jgi:peroxiredoxin
VIRVGDLVPAFEAPDEHGALFRSSSLNGEPLLIKFFRGHW